MLDDASWEVGRYTYDLEHPAATDGSVIDVKA